MRSQFLVVFWALVFVVAAGRGPAADEKADAEKELKKFKGTWSVESHEAEGAPAPAEDLKTITLVFEGDKFEVRRDGKVFQSGTQKVDPSRKPKTVDARVTEGEGKGKVMLGIYQLDGDTLKVCFDPEGKKRPTEFKTATGSGTFLNVHKRTKK